MTEQLWNVYLSLQSDLAYKGGPVAGGPYGRQLAAMTAAYLRSIGAAFQTGLIVGPGNVNEIEAFRPLIAKIVPVTIYQHELEGLRSAKLDARYGDVHDLPLKSRSFNFLYASNVLEHAFAPYIALMECRRVLSTGTAVFIMPKFDGWHGGKGEFHLHCLDEATWRELLRKCGFALSVYWQSCFDGTHTYQTFVCSPAALTGPHADLMTRLCNDKDAQLGTIEVQP